jgi:branched-subunit amino acid aminotransferase/4-amino-4-deoxychorismate lyase
VTDRSPGPLDWAWVCGRLVRAGGGAPPGAHGEPRAGAGCYTSARADHGRVLHLERHVLRLVRDAELLGIGTVDPAACLEALSALARAAFADAAGVVRLQASPRAGGAARLVGTVRALGPDPASWTAVVSPVAHPGPGPGSAAKSTQRGVFDRAIGHARRAGADEALLLDAAGRLVEGARSSVVVMLVHGALVTPPLARGAQAGIGRSLLLERVAALEEGDVGGEELAAARGIAIVNAVRGVRAIVALDGRAVDGGARGPWTEQLAHAFSRP